MNRPWWAPPTAAVLFGTGGVWPVSVRGAERVPRTGGLLFASNHLGFLDGPMLVGRAPRWVRCLVKEEMFSGPFGAVLRATGQIPVRRDRGDRAALGLALEVLAAGGCVGLFPEGTRGRGDVDDIRPGVAWLAIRSGVPVVPVACLGTRRTGASTHGVPAPRTRLELVFGEPFVPRPPQGLSGRAAVAEAGDAVRDRLAAHVASAVALTRVPLPADDGLRRDQILRGER